MNISLKTKKRIKIENFENESDRTIHLTRGRVFFFYIILIAAFMMLSYQLFSMQIVRGSDYLAAANQNYKSRSIIRAPRGNIYDIDGIKLASNIQVYSVYVDPFEFDFDQDGSQLADTLDMDPAEIEYKLRNDNVYGRVTIKNDIGHNDYLSAVKDLEKIKGVYSNAETGRIYIDDYIYSHIIGYIGDASKEDINGKVDPLSRIGKTGLEKFYDDELRGSDGIQIKELEYKSGEVERYVPTNPLPGNNIYLNIDSDWQKIAYDALDKRVRWSGGLGGAVTIMDVETGEIKVMASNPTFSLSEFSGGVSAESFSEILNNPSTPLLDRTIGVALPTGSIFKIISGSIGLQENVITDQTIYNSPGCITLPGDISFCESKDRVLGNLNIYRAIALSSNVYFCEMALDLEYTKGGIDTFKSYTDIFGIGRKTGVDLPGENSGAMPSKELKRQVYNETWYVGDLCNTSIGQGLLSATPLQMTVATAAIENGGRVLKPKLVNRFEDNNGEVIKKEESEVVENLNIEQKNLDIIKNAMKGVVRDPNGTGGKLSFVKDYLIAKTGTATAPVTINGIRYNQPHAWVTGVFEKDGRKYAFTANIAHGGWGEVSVDVMKEFFEQIYQ